MLLLFNGPPPHFLPVGRSSLAPRARVRASASPQPGLLSRGPAHAARLLLHSRARRTLRPRVGGQRHVAVACRRRPRVDAGGPCTLGFTALRPRLCFHSTPHSLSPSLPLENPNGKSARPHSPPLATISAAAFRRW
jgi:hypothetical protein